MPRLQEEASRTLSAMDEARVETVIMLYDSGHLSTPLHDGTRRQLIASWCERVGVKDIDYWLDEWFKVV